MITIIVLSIVILNLLIFCLLLIQYINKKKKETTWTKYIQKVFENSFSRKWYKTYWVFDVHSTLIKPTYDLKDKSVEFYPYALETMRIITKRPDIISIMWTSSYPEEIEHYVKDFEKLGVVFDKINENDDISSNNGNFGFYEQKFYFNVLFDDKAAFDPTKDWKPIYELFLEYEKRRFLPDKSWE
jgi:hypothetical protein